MQRYIYIEYGIYRVQYIMHPVPQSLTNVRVDEKLLQNVSTCIQVYYNIGKVLSDAGFVSKGEAAYLEAIRYWKICFLFSLGHTMCPPRTLIVYVTRIVS